MQSDTNNRLMSGSNALLVVTMLLVIGFVGYTVIGKLEHRDVMIHMEDTAMSMTKEAVRVGVIGPFSGDAEKYGVELRRGVELALTDLALGDAIRVVYADSACNATRATDAMRRLIEEDGAVVVIGEVCSGATRAASLLAEEHHIPLITPASTDPNVSDAGAYVFRTIPSDALAGEFAAEFAHDAGYERIAVLHEDSAYGLLYYARVVARLQLLKADIIASESFDRGSVDFENKIRRIVSKNPDALFVVSDDIASAVALIRYARKYGAHMTIFGSDSLLRSELLTDAATAAEGLIVLAPSLGASDFSDAFMKRFGAPPGLYAAQSYDAMTAIGRAIRYGATTSVAIHDALANTNFAGASGNIAFDANGDIGANYEAYIVRNGAFVPVSSEERMGMEQ